MKPAADWRGPVLQFPGESEEDRLNQFNSNHQQIMLTGGSACQQSMLTHSREEVSRPPCPRKRLRGAPQMILAARGEKWNRCGI